MRQTRLHGKTRTPCRRRLPQLSEILAKGPHFWDSYARWLQRLSDEIVHPGNNRLLTKAILLA
jgi:hypothetical protein